jgi:hypothetical protein
MTSSPCSVADDSIADSSACGSFTPDEGLKKSVPRLDGISE